MATFVIVHGAWGGGFSWNKIVAPLLRAKGHTVFTPTLTGLGERSHLASPDVSLDTHIQDVVNVLFYEDLKDVIFAGHSYGGAVITGVADRVPERINHLVYLDAAIPRDGESMAGSQSPERRAAMLERIEKEGEGWRLPPGPMSPDDPKDVQEWAGPRRTPQPAKTFTQPIRLTRGETALPRTYVYCTVGKPEGPNERLECVKSDPRWKVHILETGHNLHYSAPNETVEILLGAAAS
jgi:pimeloyl-ACP methyl ester carboxylesterase